MNRAHLPLDPLSGDPVHAGASVEQKALCSILMPCFRMGRFIQTALNSVAAQTYPHWELIVVDDCGEEDGTQRLVQEFAARHPANRILFLRHEENQGVSIARRTAFIEAQGEYLAFLDPDDAYEPEKLASHVAVLEKHPHVNLVHSGITAFDCDAETQAVLASNFSRGDKPHEYRLLDQAECFMGNGINNSTVVCRRSSVAAQDFPKGLIFQTEDWFLWLRLAGRGAFYFDPRPLTRYRWHPDSFSARLSKRPHALPLGLLEVLGSLYPSASSTERVRLADAMVAQLNGLIVERGLIADPPVANAGARLWRSLLMSSAHHAIADIGTALRSLVSWCRP
jgi:glycosyltransferase involved in cell wall biosynthesis